MLLKVWNDLTYTKNWKVKQYQTLLYLNLSWWSKYFYMHDSNKKHLTVFRYLANVVLYYSFNTWQESKQLYELILKNLSYNTLYQ